jgi:hypothetical protein
VCKRQHGRRRIETEHCRLRKTLLQSRQVHPFTASGIEYMLWRYLDQRQTFVHP